MRFLWVLVPALLAFAVEPPATLRGKLVPGPEPAVQAAGGKLVKLEGEADSMRVLRDARLSGADMELAGQAAGPDRFRVGPFHKPESMLVHKNGKKYTISFWCEVCSIRSYTPGKCACCQAETELSLQEYKPS